MKSFITAACIAAMLSSSPVIAGDVTVGPHGGVGCPTFDDLLTLYKVGDNFSDAEFRIFLSGHSCEILYIGAKYHLVDVQGDVTRVLSWSSVTLYAASHDFLP